MIKDDSDDEGYPLSPKSFSKKINEKIDELLRFIVNGLPAERESDLVRGQIIAYRKALEIFLNKKS